MSTVARISFLAAAFALSASAAAKPRAKGASQHDHAKFHKDQG